MNLNIRDGSAFTLFSVEEYHFFIISREMSEYVNSIYYHSCFFLWIVSLRGSWSGSCSIVMVMFELAWVTLSTESAHLWTDRTTSPTEWALLLNEKKLAVIKQLTSLKIFNYTCQRVRLSGFSLPPPWHHQAIFPITTGCSAPVAVGILFVLLW